MNQTNRIVVTGATSGLGRAIAYQLATQHQVTIIATGRRNNRLQTLQADCKQRGGIIEPYPLDLTEPTQIKKFIEEIAATELNGIILNAGITVADRFENGTLEQYQQLIQTNILANLQLIHGLLQPLEKSKGSILIVASLAGLVPVPYQSVYAGSKAFMVNLGLSLREELKSKNITVSTFAPGGIATEMTDNATFESLKDKLAPAEEVAKSCIKGYLQRKALIVPGAENKLVAFLSKLVPKTWIASIGEKIYRKTVD
ncbi:MAG: SDR family NAD(P)-dependent oxidoreductase [Bacteroidota bacterium]